jgi:fission process protein 1
VDTTETPYRYAGYANRIRTILVSAHRYVAYTSDVGESFRPVAHPWLVRSAYAISWSYILGDVGHEGYKAFLRNRRMLIPPGEAYKDATDLTTNHIVRGMATGNISGPLASDSTKSEEGETLDSLVPWPTTRIPLIDDYRMVMVQRAVFQSLASMALPAFTIHSVVRYSGRALKNSKNTLVRTWGPIGVSFVFHIT